MSALELSFLTTRQMWYQKFYILPDSEIFSFQKIWFWKKFPFKKSLFVQFHSKKRLKLTFLCFLKARIRHCFLWKLDFEWKILQFVWFWSNVFFQHVQLWKTISIQKWPFNRLNSTKTPISTFLCFFKSASLLIFYCKYLFSNQKLYNVPDFESNIYNVWDFEVKLFDVAWYSILKEALEIV